MKLVLKNSTLNFKTNNFVAVNITFGNDVEGMIPDAYITADGGVQNMSSTQSYAITPFIDIDGVLGDIDLTYVYSAYTDKVFVAFYSTNSEASFISAILREDGQTQGLAEFQVPHASIPSAAKYLRFIAQYGHRDDSSSQYASTISFNKSV